MTIGEKIQFYRKKNGMSQEELGQKLLVSRQTVSLWETGQTLPTIDNLIRLREIFGVSVDELLCEEREKENEVQLPLESYAFTYSAEECKILKKYSLASLKKSWIILAVLFGVSVFSGDLDSLDVVAGLLFGFFAATVLGLVKTYSLHKILWKKSQPQILKSEYLYDIYSNYLVFRIIRENDVKRIFKIQYSEIEKPCDIGAFFLFQVNGQLFYIRKSDLKDDSVLFGLFNKTAKKEFSDKKTKKFDIVSWALVWGSVLPLFIATNAVNALSEYNGKTVENMWMFFLFLPITIGCAIFGFKTESKNFKATKNKIVGIIMTIILFVFGMFCVIFSDMYDYDPSVIENVESCVGIDIPEHANIVTQNWINDVNGETVNGMYYSSDVTFAENVAEDFEKQLASSKKWASDLPTEIRGLFPSIYSPVTPDYYLLYNMDLNELNTVPSKTGTYRFLLVLYTADSNSMDIVEYDTEYIK